MESIFESECYLLTVQGRNLLNFCLKTLLQAGQIREDGTNCRLHIKIDHV